MQITTDRLITVTTTIAAVTMTMLYLFTKNDLDREKEITKDMKNLQWQYDSVLVETQVIGERLKVVDSLMKTPYTKERDENVLMLNKASSKAVIGILNENY